MPKMSDTMTEGVIAKWHKKVGDTVKSGELMAEIETDKATMDYESFNTGRKPATAGNTAVAKSTATAEWFNANSAFAAPAIDARTYNESV